MIYFIKRAWRGEINLKYILALWLLHFIFRIFIIAFGTFLQEKHGVNFAPFVLYFLFLPFVIWIKISFWNGLNKLSLKSELMNNSIKIIVKSIIIIFLIGYLSDLYLIINRSSL